MQNPQIKSLLFLVAAVILFLFSLALVPPVEMYCRFQRPAIALLVVQILLVLFQLIAKQAQKERALMIATFVFVTIGVALNAMLLLMARGRC